MKNIILLSDGTGNGAAKKNKTNVWRLYAALDLHNDKQIAMQESINLPPEFHALQYVQNIY